ncbi:MULTISPECIES: S66 peptidase family protein [Olivibacter]|uniref:LD-carboxypeptidase n=2 Tax=Olivibacter TaxID=376469 RepID=A0ABV6HJK8_9SPHI|nr:MULTISPECIES: S66 peptidase family protein [Olivibacter]MDM8176483.1 LD-carboxypeptidase [Olivibacter sp. 47]MDX3916063.1 LD-carboxypeptidase [Pseudosphingobacterium sp.]QEL00743.1 LD-carboxypeptidase [Olivibacter sp. LS-1]
MLLLGEILVYKKEKQRMIVDKLRPGDHIQIIAPAQSLMPKLTQEMRIRGVKRLEELGLTVSFGDHVHEIDEFGSTTIDNRLADLHRAYEDKSVKAILAVSGGTTSNQLLPYIDYKLLKDNPKILCGLSDITALINAVYAKTDVVTYYGPHFNMLSAGEDLGFSLDYFRACLFDDKPISLSPSLFYYNSIWEHEQLDNPGYWVINEGDVEGKILGGNFLTFNFLQGSEYLPDTSDSIFFLEDNGPEDYKNVQNQLQALLNQPSFSGVKALAIGRFKQNSMMTKEILTKIIKTKKQLDGIPVIANIDFGHTLPMITIPIGGRARVIADPTNPVIELLIH